MQVYGGKLAYHARRGGVYYIVYDGKELGAEENLTLYATGGELAYIERRADGEYAVYNGMEIKAAPDYKISGILALDGKPVLYVVNQTKKQNGSVMRDEKNYYLIYDGKEIGKEHDDVYDCSIVNDMIAYTAVDKGKYYVVYDGQEIGKEYDVASIPAEIGGKFTYVAGINGNYFVIRDGRQVGGEYKEFNPGKPFIKMINGRVVYGAARNNTFFFVYDGKEIGVGYPLSNLGGVDLYTTLYTTLEGKPFFVARNSKGDKYYVVREK